MARCWTCGSEIPGGLRYLFTCPTCEGVQEIKSLRKEAIDNLDELVRVQRHGFEILSDRLSEVAAVIEWGIEELSWQLQQQTDVLRSIDHTLKTPTETKANEWRLQAEELRRRGILEESEEFFLKALNEHRLDYRIYVGLAETYLQMNKFDKAMSFLEKSLPHAPQEEIDYRSYSYRLIGHIYACEEDFNRAVAVLRSSIDLSPTYEDGHYDYAQYCAQIRNTEACLTSLQKAISAKPLYWYLAKKERNFGPVRSAVEKLLSSISTEALRKARDSIAKSETALKQAREAVSEANQALTVSRDKAALNSSTMLGNADSKLKTAKDKLSSGDYVAFLEVKPITEEANVLANETINAGYWERENILKRRQEKVKNAWKRLPLRIILWSFLFGWIGSIVGGIGALIIFGDPRVKGPFIGFWLFGILVGIVFAVIFVIHRIKKELR